MSKQRFIAQAIKRPGALTAKANASGSSVAGFAAANQDAPGRTGAEARFYENVLKPANAKRKKKHSTLHRKFGGK